MRTATLASLLALPACAEDPIELGDIQAIESGDGRIEITACLEVEGESCARSPMDITLDYDGQQTTLPYGGFIFASYGTDLELRDRDAAIVLTHGYDEARMHLPPAFDLTASTSTLSRDGSVTLTWQPGASPMLWDLAYQCDGSGWARGWNIEDDGHLILDAADIFDRVDRDDPTRCLVTVRLSRVHAGTIDPGFGADLATGITRRYVRL